MRNDQTIKQSRDYLTNLFMRRSVVALCCGVLTLALSFYGIIAGVIRTVEKMGQNGFFSFVFYTMLANTLAAVSVAFMIPYAVEGIWKRRFVLPKWVAVLHYLATSSISIMLVFVLAFISWASPEDAFGGSNLVTHVFCPVLILLSFFQVENGVIYSIKDRFIGCLPSLIYMIVYCVEVCLIGEANGGWPDLYHVQEHMPPLLAIPAFLLFGFTVCSLIAIVSNRLTKRRRAKMFLNWRADAEPVEVRIEAYGLGRTAGMSGKDRDISIPLDILAYFSEKYHLETDELIKAYIAGFLNGRKERKDKP